jgi:hypothetical protein
MPLGGNKIRQGDEPRRKIKQSPSWTFVGLNRQPHINQLKHKMIKGEGNDMDMAEHMVIGQGKEKT